MKKLVSFIVLLLAIGISSIQANVITFPDYQRTVDISNGGRMVEDESSPIGYDFIDYEEDDIINISAAIEHIYLPEDPYTIHPRFNVADANPLYLSDFYGNLYEKLDDGNLRLISVASSFSESISTPFELPAEITEIGSFAVSQSDRIGEIRIPATVEFIDETALAGSNIRAIRVHPENPCYASISGSLYNKKTKKLLKVADDSVESISIPDGILSIADYAFLGTDIKNISLPSSLEDVGPFSFLREVYDKGLDFYTSYVPEISLRDPSEHISIYTTETVLENEMAWPVSFLIEDSELVSVMKMEYWNEESYNSARRFGLEGDYDWYYEDFKTLTLPDVESIGPYSLSGVRTIDLIFSSATKVIDSSAFAGADIENLYLGKNTEKIIFNPEYHDFLYLSKVVIPDSLVEMFGYDSAMLEEIMKRYRAGEFEIDSLYYNGPGYELNADLYMISKESPFYEFYYTLDPYSVETMDWL